MKIHSQCPCLKFNGCPKQVPDKFLNEEWAQRNHDQSIARLNERGGLTVGEILAIVQRRRWSLMDNETALTILIHMLRGYKIGIDAGKETKL